MSAFIALLRSLLEGGKYFVLFASASTLVASAATFIWATVAMVRNAWQLVGEILGRSVHSDVAGVGIISALDTLLMAVILYIFSIALYELFIGKLTVPEWLAVKNLDGLKEKLASVVILILAVTFLKHLVNWEDASNTFLFGLTIAAVIFSLVFYMKHKKGSE